MESIKNNKRYFYLDWIKVIATAGVYILHVSHIFDNVPFQIQNNETSQFFLIIVAYLNFWIMPLFFLVAGASSEISLKKRDNNTYIKERSIRLLIPFFTGLFILALPQDYVEALNYGRFSGSFSNFIPFHLNNVVRLIKNTNILYTPALFAEFAHHVWFLAFLYLYSLLTLPLFRFLQSQGSKLLQSLTIKMNSPLYVYILAFPLFLILATLKPLDVTYSGWPSFFYWGTFFILGFIIFSNQKILNMLSDDWYVYLTTGMISFGLILVYLVELGTGLIDNPDYSLISIMGQFLWTLTAFSWVLFFIGASKKWINFKSKYLLPLVTGSMAFYLLHLPVVLIVAFFVVKLELNLYMKFGIIFIVSLLVAILMIKNIVKRAKPISFLFGMK